MTLGGTTGAPERIRGRNRSGWRRRDVLLVLGEVERIRRGYGSLPLARATTLLTGRRLHSDEGRKLMCRRGGLVYASAGAWRKFQDKMHLAANLVLMCRRRALACLQNFPKTGFTRDELHACVVANTLNSILPF
jgi:hypothetical protein